MFQPQNDIKHKLSRLWVPSTVHLCYISHATVIVTKDEDERHCCRCLTNSTRLEYEEQLGVPHRNHELEPTDRATDVPVPVECDRSAAARP
jgi:hypothetical protein